jgi:6-phospho-beta-glucosidase
MTKLIYNNRGDLLLKVTVIGGGSTYTPELLNGFFHYQHVFPLDELWLMDIDRSRLNVVGGFVQRIAAAKNARFKIIHSTNQREAIQDASYVITQTRVGKMEARRQDEYLGKRHGLIGQETTGVGGMAKALRTIPVILGVARDIERFAPDALLVNFANPAGLVTEALFRHVPAITSVGVCNSALSTKMELVEELRARSGIHIQPEDAQIKCLGLNHLTWFYGLEVNGVDYWPLIMAGLIQQAEKQETPQFDVHTLKSLNMLPNYYLSYYNNTDRMLELQAQWPPSRAEQVFKIEADLLEQYQDETRVDLPEDMMKRGGAFYSTVAAQLLNAHYNDLHQPQVLNIRHNGAVAGWEKDWVVEMPCEVSAQGVVPLPADPLPLVCEGLIAQVKAYEILTVEAAVNGDRDAAYQALLAHPLGPAADKIHSLLEEMLTINRDYLPQFMD